jgi:hypothetical protein
MKEPSDHESQQGFDYICPPTVKWLLYPDSDDDDEQELELDDRKFMNQFQNHFRLD